MGHSQSRTLEKRVRNILKTEGPTTVSIDRVYQYTSHHEYTIAELNLFGKTVRKAAKSLKMVVDEPYVYTHPPALVVKKRSE